MVSVQIVSDSCAYIVNPQSIQRDLVTIVPNKIHIGGKIYREGVDISAEEALNLIGRQSVAPTVTVPSVAEYVDTYTRLSRSVEAIISIHASREIYPSWQNAKVAAQQVVGHCPVVVIDSQTLCVAQGMLVKVALKALEQESTLDDMVRRVRGAIDRIYSVYYVESIDYLLQNKVMGLSHTILGALLGIKPFLTIENGHLTPIEKVRTRAQAIERLVEFAVEFTDIEDTVTVQPKTQMTEQTRTLQDRLAVEFPKQKFPYSIYGTTMAALIGGDATGVIVLERELEDIDDDF